MPEVTHWKCDREDCGAISPMTRPDKSLVGWTKVSLEAPFLEPIVVILCPQHSNETAALLSKVTL